MRLFQREGCPFGAKVRRTLTDLGLSCEVVNVPKLASERAELLKLVDDPTVPVLVDGEQVIQGSGPIIGHLRETYGGGFGDPSYGLTRRFAGRTFDEVVAATRAALGTEGFGVLTEIDVKATLKKKLDVDRPEYLILGACNPPLANQAINGEPGIGLLLPCNVVVARDGDQVVVSAIDPVKMFRIVERDELEPVAVEVGQRLRRVLSRI